MANNGITFDNFWSYPLCAPTRASILTGRYGYRNGVLDVTTTSQLSTTEKSLQSYIDEQTNQAYSQAVIGKWHLSGNNESGPASLGINHFAGILGGGVGDYSFWNLTENEETTVSTEYTTSKITDLAIDWIKAQDQPWFCWVAYNAAHTPFHLPPDSLHSYDNLPTDETSIDANPQAYYLAMLESMDTEMGRLMANIPPTELANTTIIFIGDNGTPGQVVQSPFTSNKSKGSLFQGGINTPMIVSGKGVTRIGQRDNSLINSTDLFSTIANLAGIGNTTYEDSQSAFPLFTTSGSGTREYNYSEMLNVDNLNKSGFTIRNDRYKLISPDSGNNRFYDLQNDPYEENNIINDLSNEESLALAELQAKVNEIRN